VTEESGVFWDGLRGWIARSGRDLVTKDLTKYAEGTYEGELASFNGDDPPDITQPAKFTVTIKKAHRVFTYRDQIDAYFFPSDVLTRLPSSLDDRNASDRRLDYEWSVPFVYEIENRVEVPPGHTMPQLQPHETLPVGTMTLTTDRRIDGDTLVVSYRLETGKLRLSASEVAATRKAIGELRSRHAEHLVIVRTAIALLKDRKAREAVAEIQRMIALHPKEALHYDQLAGLYAGLGLGGAARRIARKAVEIEPTSADGHLELGFRLRHDTLGRLDGFDSDRKGALAEFRKAIQLAPTHRGALAELASLLAIDGDRTMSTKRDDLLEAAALWRHANDVRKDHDFDAEIANALWVAGEVAEVEQMARVMPDSSTRSAFLVASSAVLRGAKDAIAIATTLASNPKPVLVDAISKLKLVRRYDLVRELFDAVKRPTTPRDVVEQIVNLKPVDLAKLDPADPKTAAFKFVAAMAGLRVPNPPWDGELEKRISEGATPQRDKFRAFPAAVAIDLFVATFEMSFEGDASAGWRVDIGVPPHPERFKLYITSQRGVARVVGASHMFFAGVARHAHTLLQRGELATSTRWLKWAARDHPKTLKSLEPQLDDAANPTRDVLELAIAFLLIDEDPKVATPILQRCPTTDQSVKKKTCRAALASTLGALERWSELADLTRELVDEDPSSMEWIPDRAWALARLGRIADAIALVDQSLAKVPDDLMLIRARARLAFAAGNLADARTWFDKSVAHAKAIDLDFNDAAWARLFLDKTYADARAIAARMEQPRTPLDDHNAHTIAAIEAESDNPSLAWSYLTKALAARGSAQPREQDWYVLGRIAESLDLRDDAVAAYRRVAKPKPSRLQDHDSYELAQRGLRRLGVK
jgi:tetratricopeptide (TPR) repeat protein